MLGTTNFEVRSGMYAQASTGLTSFMFSASNGHQTTQNIGTTHFMADTDTTLLKFRCGK